MTAPKLADFPAGASLPRELRRTPTWLHNRQTERAIVRDALTLERGSRVDCRSLSGAGGPGTVSDWDAHLVYVRLDSGPTRSFLATALRKLP